MINCVILMMKISYVCVTLHGMRKSNPQDVLQYFYNGTSVQLKFYQYYTSSSACNCQLSIVEFILYNVL